jgi:hypothetical protein
MGPTCIYGIEQICNGTQEIIPINVVYLQSVMNELFSNLFHVCSSLLIVPFRLMMGASCAVCSLSAAASAASRHASAVWKPSAAAVS